MALPRKGFDWKAIEERLNKGQLTIPDSRQFIRDLIPEKPGSLPTDFSEVTYKVTRPHGSPSGRIAAPTYTTTQIIPLAPSHADIDVDKEMGYYRERMDEFWATFYGLKDRE